MGLDVFDFHKHYMFGEKFQQRKRFLLEKHQPPLRAGSSIANRVAKFSFSSLLKLQNCLYASRPKYWINKLPPGYTSS